jgi:hypothetical protein
LANRVNLWQTLEVCQSYPNNPPKQNGLSTIINYLAKIISPPLTHEAKKNVALANRQGLPKLGGTMPISPLAIASSKIRIA